MAEEEFRDSFNKLKIKAEKVMEAKDDMEAGLVAELEMESDTTEVSLLTKQQKSCQSQDCKQVETEGDQKSKKNSRKLWNYPLY